MGEKMTKFLFYESRNGLRLLVPHNEKGWEFLKKHMQDDNRCTFEEAVEQFGEYSVEGDLEYSEDAHISMDDGGSIHTAELTVLVEDAKYF